MKTIAEMNERVTYKMSRTFNQTCLYCGKPMGVSVGLCLSNKGDKLTIHKNLWVHASCVEAFGKALIKNFKDNQGKLVAHSL